MNDASEWRLNLARQIVARYTGVEAAMLVGSAALGLADAHSDLDLLLYWRAVPSETWRKARLTEMNAALLWMANTADGDDDPALQSQSEEFLLKPSDLKVDITHKQIAAVEALIADVAEKGDTTRTKLLILGGMSNGIALHRDALVGAWQKRSERLPEAIAAHLIQTHLHNLPSADDIAIAIKRGAILHTRDLLIQLCNQLVYALIALNRHYPPVSLKHLGNLIGQLEYKPMHLHSTITNICTVTPEQALAQTRNLVAETFELIATMGHDSNLAQDRFTATRSHNDQAINLNEELNNA